MNKNLKYWQNKYDYHYFQLQRCMNVGRFKKAHYHREKLQFIEKKIFELTAEQDKKVEPKPYGREIEL